MSKQFIVSVLIPNQNRPGNLNLRSLEKKKVMRTTHTQKVNNKYERKTNPGIWTHGDKKGRLEKKYFHLIRFSNRYKLF
jgi:mannosyltransferase OCH1-like enzyme